MNNIILLNQCTVDSSYDEITKTQYEFCLKKHPDNIMVINYYGGFDKNNNLYPQFINKPINKIFQEDGRWILILECQDIVNHDKNFDPRGEKQLFAFEYCLKNFEFDFIFRINCTCYVNFTNLNNYINNLKHNSTHIYTGLQTAWSVIEGDLSTMFYFVVGGCCLISKDLTQLTSDNRDKYLELTSKNLLVDSYEDVCLGRLFNWELKLPTTTFEVQPRFPYWVNYKNDWEGEEVVEYNFETITYRFNKEGISKFVKIYNLYKKQHE
jgi:hypothetical protein